MSRRALLGMPTPSSHAARVEELGCVPATPVDVSIATVAWKSLKRTGVHPVRVHGRGRPFSELA